jgi:ParB family chromosome partitioning protein
MRQMLRLATALRNGFAEPIETALRESSARDPESQWQTLLPYLVESERFATAEPEPDTPARARLGRPQRISRPRPGLVIRREIARDGYLLRFTGKEATSSLLDEVLDEIERIYSPG